MFSMTLIPVHLTPSAKLKGLMVGPCSWKLGKRHMETNTWWNTPQELAVPCVLLLASESSLPSLRLNVGNFSKQMWRLPFSKEGEPCAMCICVCLANLSTSFIAGYFYLPHTGCLTLMLGFKPSLTVWWTKSVSLILLPFSNYFTRTAIIA